VATGEGPVFYHGHGFVIHRFPWYQNLQTSKTVKRKGRKPSNIVLLAFDLQLLTLDCFMMDKSLSNWRLHDLPRRFLPDEARNY